MVLHERGNNHVGNSRTSMAWKAVLGVAYWLVSSQDGNRSQECSELSEVFIADVLVGCSGMSSLEVGAVPAVAVGVRVCIDSWRDISSRLLVVSCVD